jgi:hypothetical protein
MRERGLLKSGFQHRPGAVSGGGIFDRRSGEFSTGVDINEDPSPNWIRKHAATVSPPIDGATPRGINITLI